MTEPQTRALLHEIDQYRAVLDLAGEHIVDGKFHYADAALAVVANGAERLRHAMDDQACCAAIVAEIQARPEYRKTRTG